MKLWCFTMPAKGQINAEIEAETEEEARKVLQGDGWDFLDEYCYDPKVEDATLTSTFPL